MAASSLYYIGDTEQEDVAVDHRLGVDSLHAGNIVM